MKEPSTIEIIKEQIEILTEKTLSELLTEELSTDDKLKLLSILISHAN